ncbi:unnamed protein product, partial [Mesorhabditis spiculigera]
MFSVARPLSPRVIYGGSLEGLPNTQIVARCPSLTAQRNAGSGSPGATIHSSSKPSDDTLPKPLKLDVCDLMGFRPFEMPRADQPEKKPDASVKLYRRIISYAQPCALCQKAVKTKALVVVLPCSHILHPECADEMTFNHRPCDRCEEQKSQRKSLSFYLLLMFCCF